MKKEFKDKLLLITYAVVLFVILQNSSSWLIDTIILLGKVLLPFVIGIIIAFILNVLMKIISIVKSVKNTTNTLIQIMKRLNFGMTIKKYV